jgi:hypothetical protein
MQCVFCFTKSYYAFKLGSSSGCAPERDEQMTTKISEKDALEMTVEAGRDLETARLHRMNAQDEYNERPSSQTMERLIFTHLAENSAQDRLNDAQDLYGSSR